MEPTGNNIGTQLVFQPHMGSALYNSGNVFRVVRDGSDGTTSLITSTSRFSSM